MMRYLFLVFYSACAFAAQIHEQVLICGVCRNVAPRLEKMQRIMESIGDLFDDYRMLIYENNSTDQTSSILLSWAQMNPRIWVKSEWVSQQELENNTINIHSDGTLFRPEQIARARNIILEKAMSSAYEDLPYLIWLDMDFVRAPDLDGFIDTFQSSKEWDAVFAYGIDPDHNYWDWYAFRDANNPIGPELLGMEWYDNMGKEKKEQTSRSIAQNNSWYPVYSAFGGCGIYKKSSIQGCRYSAIVTPDLEHHAKQLLNDNNHPQIIKYLNLNKNLESIYLAEEARPNLPSISNSNYGIKLHRGTDALIWRMNTFVYQYPSICEHVPFHASMIVHKHDKLYINPKLVFRYGD